MAGMMKQEFVDYAPYFNYAPFQMPGVATQNTANFNNGQMPPFYAAGVDYKYNPLQRGANSNVLVTTDYESATVSTTTGGVSSRRNSHSSNSTGEFGRPKPPRRTLSNGSGQSSSVGEPTPFECDLCGMKIKHKRNIYRHKRTRWAWSAEMVLFADTT